MFIDTELTSEPGLCLPRATVLVMVTRYVCVRESERVSECARVNMSGRACVSGIVGGG